MKKITLILGIACMVISCTSDKKKSEALEGDGIENKSSEKYACLEDYENRYDELASLNDMASVYPFEDQDYEVDLSNRSYGNHTITWPSDRPNLDLEVAGTKMNLPDQNSMSVAVLTTYPEDLSLEEVRKRFEMGYKELTQEELEQINKNLEKVEGEVGETGKKLMDVRQKMNYAKIDNIGTSAWYKWSDSYGGELAVLGGRTKFDIRIRISSDSVQNLEYSKKLAMLILGKCK